MDTVVTVISIVAIYLLITFLAIIWTAILLLPLGALLREFHFEFASNPSFRILRYRGLRHGIRPYIKDLKRRAMRSWGEASEILWLHALFIVTPIFSLMVNLFSFGGVTFLMRPLWNYMNLKADNPVMPWHTIFIFGGVGATWIFYRGVSYIARPWIKHRGRYEQIRLPKNLDLASQNRIAIDSFWLAQVRTASIFIAMSAAWIWAPIMVANGPILGFDPVNLGPLLIPIFFLWIGIPTIITSWFIQRLSVRWSGVEALVRITQIIDPIDPPTGNLAPGQSDPLPEPNYDLRAKTVTIVELLHNMANRLDAQQPIGFTPHPIATMLRGCSAQLTDFLHAPNFRRSPPSDITKIFRLLQQILSGPKNASPYEELASVSRAFEADGSPVAKPAVKPPGKMARLFAKTTLNLKSLLVTIGAFATLALPIAAIIFALLGQIDIAKLLELLKR